MDYNKIETFNTVARFGSVTKAAHHLRRSQSAITQQIQALESELSLKLFIRKHGRVYLSKEGERVFNVSQNRLSEISNKISEIQGELGELSGLIKIGYLDDGSTSFDIRF